jgi:hypothetical protein
MANPYRRYSALSDAESILSGHRDVAILRTFSVVGPPLASINLGTCGGKMGAQSTCSILYKDIRMKTYRTAMPSSKFGGSRLVL